MNKNLSVFLWILPKRRRYHILLLVGNKLCFVHSEKRNEKEVSKLLKKMRFFSSVYILLYIFIKYSLQHACFDVSGKNNAIRADQKQPVFIPCIIHFQCHLAGSTVNALAFIFFSHFLPNQLIFSMIYIYINHLRKISLNLINFFFS